MTEEKMYYTTAHGQRLQCVPSVANWGKGPPPPPPTPPACIGVDVGQQRDYSCIAAVEPTRPSVADPWTHNVRFLERLALGTSYPRVADRVARVLANVRAMPLPEGCTEPRRITCVVDVTGVGRPLYDLIRQRAAGTGAMIVAATFTHGDRLTPTGKDAVSVGKAALVSRLQVLLQDRRLILPASVPWAQVMIDELLNYEIRVSPEGNDQYGAWAVGKHDDAVTAVGLAALFDPVPAPRFADVVAI